MRASYSQPRLSARTPVPSGRQEASRSNCSSANAPIGTENRKDGNPHYQDKRETFGESTFDSCELSFYPRYSRHRLLYRGTGGKTSIASNREQLPLTQEARGEEGHCRRHHLVK
jgi:hypothetical protein